MLIRPRAIDYRTGVFAAEVTPGVPGEKPVRIKMIDAGSKEHVETLEVDACMVATGRVPFTNGLGLDACGIETMRGFVQVNEMMQVRAHTSALRARAPGAACAARVRRDGRARARPARSLMAHPRPGPRRVRVQVLDKPDGKVVPHLYCIGDANGKMMLAHAASAQGISAVENIAGKKHVVNHEAIPAACFTHPEIAFVGLDEAMAKERAEKEGFELGIGMGNFRANSKVRRPPDRLTCWASDSCGPRRSAGRGVARAPCLSALRSPARPAPSRPLRRRLRRRRARAWPR